MKLPQEIEWNILKFMSHPVADLLKDEWERLEWEEVERCDCCMVSRWECQCWCSNCYQELACCRYRCYDTCYLDSEEEE